MAAGRGIWYHPPVRSVWFVIAVVLLSGCASAIGNRLSKPDKNVLVRDQLVIHSDFALAAHHRLFEELLQQRDDICQQLSLPKSDEPIDVYLFNSPERFASFIRLHYPMFPERRAFFVQTDTQLAVYAQWGDRLGDDLRHEITHAYVHSVAPNVPLWLDEGLAKYFEVGRGRHGLNGKMLAKAITKLDQQPSHADLRRLEAFAANYNMTQEDYAEAWAWVHFMMESRPETLALLRTYFFELRRDGAAAPLSGRLAAMFGQPAAVNAALIDHLRRNAGLLGNAK
jgi:hypothetical protein